MAQQIFSCEIVNRELELGRRVFLNGFSPKMASPRKWLLPSKWLLPENGFSSEITSPQEIQNKSHFNLRDS